MTKSLAEAAAEVLNASRATAPKETFGVGLNLPGKTAAERVSGGTQDIGGVTTSNPMGNVDIGSKAAHGAPSATPPGVPPASDSSEKFGAGLHLPGSDAAHAVSDQKAGEKVDLEDAEHTDQEDKLLHVPEETDVEAARAERWEEIRKAISSMSVKEDVDAMLAGSELSEEFKTKVTTIFEAAVLSRAVAVAEQLEAQILEDAEQAVEEVRAELEEKVDSYLNFVIENWVKENEVAIESGLKSEVIEGFIAGLKNLFTEHYVEVPEGKEDVLESAQAEVAALTEKLNEALNQNIELTKQIAGGKRSEILNKVCEGLTAVQAEKVKALAEGVEFTTEGDYTKKLGVIRENYFPAKVKQDATAKTVALTESESPAEVKEEIEDPSIRNVVAALDRFNRK